MPSGRNGIAARRDADPTIQNSQVEKFAGNISESRHGIAAYAYEFGVLKDREFLTPIVSSGGGTVHDGALYATIDMPNGRYDRYSNEYIRFCWKPASRGRKASRKLKPSMKAQMILCGISFRTRDMVTIGVGVRGWLAI